MLNKAVGMPDPGQTGSGIAPVLMLGSRMVLFAVWQALIAVVYFFMGHAHPWEASVAWWPITVVLTNFTSFFLLRMLARREGMTWWQLIGADFRREYLGKDLLWFLLVLVLAGPIAMIPNVGLAQWLYGDAQVAVDLFTRPLPVAVAAISLVAFPFTMPIGEMPTYFGYVMPRLTRRFGRGWAITLASLALGFQHATLPLIFDGRFVVWRLLMFVPFAFLLGVAVQKRPRLLVYFMMIHPLIDLAAAYPVWRVSVGG
ncbi:MAG TPA: CPBP family glutamic-type intramembrane protease [Symbiobacteriaceae bacterium]|nr:CPBP family glutamic-type intramembrane protease [Symbiobacteriaceae bacterium]